MSCLKRNTNTTKEEIQIQQKSNGICLQFETKTIKEPIQTNKNINTIHDPQMELVYSEIQIQLKKK